MPSKEVINGTTCSVGVQATESESSSLTRGATLWDYIAAEMQKKRQGVNGISSGDDLNRAVQTNFTQFTQPSRLALQ